MSQPDAPSERPDSKPPEEEERPPSSEEERPSDFRLYTGEPLETEDGTYTPMQQNAGRFGSEGGGEFPDPATPPRPPAPGAVEDDDPPLREGEP